MVDGDDGLTATQPLSVSERKTLQEFLQYIEHRVRSDEPFCAYLIRMAHIALDPMAPLEDLVERRVMN